VSASRAQGTTGWMEGVNSARPRREQTREA
jgi:hypothetical protein